MSRFDLAFFWSCVFSVWGDYGSFGTMNMAIIYTRLSVRSEGLPGQTPGGRLSKGGLAALMSNDSDLRQGLTRCLRDRFPDALGNMALLKA